MVVTIGGGANDGEVGELDNVSISVENITGGPGDDTITGSAVANLLLGGVDPDPTLDDGDTGNDTLIGGLGDDTLSGFDGNDELFGEEDADTLHGGVGADILDGGLGSGDRVSYPGRTSGVTVNQNKPGGDGQGGAAEGDDVRASVERVTGTAFADTLVGGKVNASILIGGGGGDVLNGGNGHDDIVNGGAGNDRINDNGGRDTFVGSLGNDIFHTSDGARDLINCGKGPMRRPIATGSTSARRAANDRGLRDLELAHDGEVEAPFARSRCRVAPEGGITGSSRYPDGSVAGAPPLPAAWSAVVADAAPVSCVSSAGPTLASLPAWSDPASTSTGFILTSPFAEVHPSPCGTREDLFSFPGTTISGSPTTGALRELTRRTRLRVAGSGRLSASTF